MGVVPERVGADDLAVHEGAALVEGLDQGAPCDGQPPDAELVIEDGAGPTGQGFGREHLEVQPGRGEPLEVGGICEEGEDLGAGHGQILGDDEPFLAHQATRSASASRASLNLKRKPLRSAARG